MDKGGGHWGGQVEDGLPVLVVVSPVVEILMFFGWVGLAHRYVSPLIRPRFSLLSCREVTHSLPHVEHILVLSVFFLTISRFVMLKSRLFLWNFLPFIPLFVLFS
jgi:hypothetical protein